MLKIGLTGGIGTGKSIVAKVFQLLGIPVYVSDVEAKRLMQESAGIRNSLIDEFGSEVYDHNLNLNRKYLADTIFNNPQALQTVNSIVHPVVRADFEEWCKRQNASYTILESAILFDTGLYKDFDKIICVTADENLRIERVVKRDKVTAKSVKERVKSQIPEKEKINQSDFVIYNNYELVVPQIIEIDQILRSLEF